MKKAIKISIKKFVEVNGTEQLADEKTGYICGYCESKYTYQIKSENAIYCRKCGKKSKLPDKEE